MIDLSSLEKKIDDEDTWSTVELKQSSVHRSEKKEFQEFPPLKSVRLREYLRPGGPMWWK